MVQDGRARVAMMGGDSKWENGLLERKFGLEWSVWWFPGNWMGHQRFAG